MDVVFYTTLLIIVIGTFIWCLILYLDLDLKIKAKLKGLKDDAVQENEETPKS